MSVWCVSISHQTVPLAIREQLALSPEQQQDMTAQLAAKGGESFVLTTCNRVELYWLAPPGPDPNEALCRLATTTSVNPDLVRTLARLWQGEDAVRHLCRVAAGLESQILGEPEILGQVRAAGDAARRFGTLGPVLDRLVRLAVATGKRARTETAISRGPQSTAHAAVRLAATHLGGLAGRRILVIGAGNTGRRITQLVRLHHPAWLGITNRTAARATAVATETSATTVPWEKRAVAAASCDAVFIATSAPSPVLNAAHLTAARNGHTGHPLVIVDLAVPRNADPALSTVPGVTLVNVEMLGNGTPASVATRAAAVPQVEVIVEEAVAAFRSWEQARAAVPQIAALCAWAEQVRAHQVEKALRKLQHLSERDREIVLGLSYGLIHQLLHWPITALRTHSTDPHLQEAARIFFPLGKSGLPSSPEPCPNSTPQNQSPPTP